MPEESAGNGDQIRGNDSMKKKRKTGRIILRILLRLLLLLIIFSIFGAAIWYVARTHTYEDRFIEGTLINGTDVGGKTKDEVAALVERICGLTEPGNDAFLRDLIVCSYLRIPEAGLIPADK